MATDGNGNYAPVARERGSSLQELELRLDTELTGAARVDESPDSRRSWTRAHNLVLVSVLLLAVGAFAAYKVSSPSESTKKRSFLRGWLVKDIQEIFATSTSTTTSTFTTTSTASTTTTTSTSTTVTSVTTITITETTTTTTFAPTSLYCFSLMLPRSSEQELMLWQFSQRQGIFACDHAAVYTNETVDTGDMPFELVHTSLFAPIGGSWNTRLNTDIFRKLWRQVINDGKYKYAAWTVKVDPDAVFLPTRLRQIVGRPDHAEAQTGNGMFSNNCRCTNTMHGPIEVISRRALEVYAAESDAKCQGQVMWLPAGQRPEQEDVFMRLCMIALGAKQVSDYELLSEQYCDMDWTCKDGLHVSYHPFKTASMYKDCLANAEQAADMKTYMK